MLRSALCSCHADSAWTMCQAHTRLDFIAMLSSWPTGDEKLKIGVSLQGGTIGRIAFRQNLLLIMSLANVDYQYGFSPCVIPGLSETSSIIQSSLFYQIVNCE